MKIRVFAYMSYMSKNFRLVDASNLAVINIQILLLEYPGSVCVSVCQQTRRWPGPCAVCPCVYLPVSVIQAFICLSVSRPASGPVSMPSGRVATSHRPAPRLPHHLQPPARRLVVLATGERPPRTDGGRPPADRPAEDCPAAEEDWRPAAGRVQRPRRASVRDTARHQLGTRSAEPGRC